MSSREAQKIKKAIEDLRRLPENKRCADCQSLAVPYVCIDFGTFICTRCSGIHREFAHRVKSIAASNFKQEEQIAMRGNKVDAEEYLANWTEQIFPLPAAGNEGTPKAREFIQLKYEQKRWALHQPQAQQVQQFGVTQQPQQQFQDPSQFQRQQQTTQQYNQPQQPIPQPAQQPFAQMAPPQRTLPFNPNTQAPQQFQQPAQQVAVQQQPPVQQQVEDPFADMFGGAQPAPAAMPVQQPVNQQQFQFQPQPVQQPSQPQAFQPQFQQTQNIQYQPVQQQSFQPQQPQQFQNPQFKSGEPSHEPQQTAFSQFQQPAFQPSYGQPQYQQPSSQKFNPAQFVQPQQTQKPAKGYDMFAELVNQSVKQPVPTQQPKTQPQVQKPKPAGGDLLDF